MTLEIILNFKTKHAILSSKAAEKHLKVILLMGRYKEWRVEIKS